MSEQLCPNCRKPLSENTRFCIECGSRIDFQLTRKELNDYEPQEKKVTFRERKTIKEISDKLIDNIGEEREDIKAGIKENRIITVPVGGGFKKRAPQVEEIKDMGAFFKKRNRRR